VDLQPPHSAERQSVIAADRFGNWTHLDEHWTELTGLSVDASLRKPLADFIHPEDRARVLEAVQSVIRGEIYSCRYPMRLQRKDGMHCWVEIFAYPTLNSSGRIDGLRGTLTDIADRRKGLAPLRESEARFRALSEASRLGLCVTDAKGNCTFSNPNFHAIAGLRPDQAMGPGHLSTAHPDDAERLLALREIALKNETAFRSEHRYLHSDGTVVWAHMNAAPILDGGKCLGFVQVIEDVSDRRLDEEMLRRSRERLQLALEGSGDALVDWDLRTGEVFLSEQWGRITDVTTAPAVTTMKGLQALVHPDDVERLREAIEETLQEQRPFLRLQYRVRTGSGAWKWVETHARVVERGPGDVPLRMTGTTADITERKAVEERQAQFVATVSHELRTPLAAVLGALGVLHDDYYEQIPTAARRFLDMALRNGEQLGALIHSVLDLEAVETGVHSFHFRAVPAMEVLQRCAELNAGFALKFSVTLTVVPCARDSHVWADPDRLLQILTNFVSNAVKFSSTGSVVTLYCTTEEDRVRFCVEDHGPGIPEEFRSRVFQRFAQPKQADSPRAAGSGLGLSICKALAERMNGAVGYSSIAGEGSVFYVELPSARASAPVSASSDSED
jgi:PAS domain S-box-containing protein